MENKIRMGLSLWIINETSSQLLAMWLGWMFLFITFHVCGNTQKQEVNEPKGERRTAAGAVSSPQYLQFYVSHYIDVKVKMSNRGEHRFCNTKKHFTQLQIKHCLTDSCDKHPVFVQQWKHALQLQPALCNLSHPEDTPVSKEKRCIWLIYDNIYQITWVWFFMTPFFLYAISFCLI